MIPDNYKVIRNFLNKDLTNFLYKTFLLERSANVYNSMHDKPTKGTFGDPQTKNSSYSVYSLNIFETLMIESIPVLEEVTKTFLVPTYSYARIYENGEILKRHTDRPHCEISATINLGGDPWSIFIDSTGGKNNEGVEVLLNPGDLMVYNGFCEHWREPFEGNNCAQAFLHYVPASNPDAETLKFDGRPMLNIDR